ncbi:nicotinamide-nucleotide adenylyltransferase [Candidatus Woesearchaeota archaeon]|nr:nicotinamide-nucleotide adenylyltransferase [Candidatus Woesearchaeota archaeon]
MSTALFIGRFQPFHKAHLQDIKNILKDCDKLIISIGSSQHSNTQDNPFSFEERIEMIEDALISENIGNYTIFPVPDVGNDSKWIEHLITLVPKFDIVYTGNDWTEKCFKNYKEKFMVKKIKLIPGINSTTIRDKMIKNENWQELVPETVIGFIKRVKGAERIKKICR